MHPTSRESLDIGHEEWVRVHGGIEWLITEVFGVYDSLHARIEDRR
jgi:hypothetical protein